MTYKLKPTVYGNPDKGQDPNKKPYGVDVYTIIADTLPRLAIKVQEWQEENGIGGGNWGHCKVFKDNKLLGFMSYNGRVWNKQFWDATATEIKE